MLTNLLNCLCCGSSKLYKYLNLSDQPPPNAFHRAYQEVKSFPLEINVCQNCWHSQVATAVDPSLLFDDYHYRTGVSNTLVAHYNELAESVLDEFLESKDSISHTLNVLDIGCNDGTLLKAFHKHGHKTFGVDPCCTCKSDDVGNFQIGYWGEDDIQFNDKMDIITATNVLAHNFRPITFLLDAAKVLSFDGVMVIEFPYARHLIERCEFDTMYHEHYSYFNINSFTQLLKGTGLRIIKVNQVGVHGGSLRVMLVKCFEYEEIKHSHHVIQDMIAAEAMSGIIGNLNTYLEFSDKVSNVKNQVKSLTDQIRAQYRSMIGFGASGKGTVFLNYMNLKLDYIVDETPAKQGKLSPGMDVPVVGMERLKNPEPLDILIMAWNCLPECLEKLRAIRKPEYNDYYITYVPDVSRKPLFSKG